MRRGAAEDRERVFNHTLDSADDIGRVEGLTGLTARRLAKSVGCSVGTIYNVFGNLDTLILHLNGRTLDGLYNSLSDIELVKEPETAIRQITGGYRRYTTENAKLWGIIFEHTWPADYVLPDWYPDKIQQLLGLLAKALQPLLPGANQAEVDQAAAVLWSGLHGINSLALTGKIGLVSSESVNEMTELMVGSFVRGLAAKPTPAR